MDQHRTRLAFLYSVPISLLGGLIGLGGAEFRLPVLAGPLGYSLRQAVPLNLAVSLVTLIVSLIIRSRILTFAGLEPFIPAILTLIVGAVVGAFFGTALAHRLSSQRLEHVIPALLVMIGMGLIAEGFLPQEIPALLPGSLGWHIGAGLFIGLGIGLVSSLLGVAGGELIIPTLIFAFGVDIKLAGTGSLFVSLPTVLVGLVRYASRGAFAERRTALETIVPMSLGSVIGAIAGGLLVGVIPAAVLKVALGVILNISAFRILRRAGSRQSQMERA